MLFNKIRVNTSIFYLHISQGISLISISHQIPEEKKIGLSIRPCHTCLSKVSVKLYFVGTYISFFSITVGASGDLNIGLLGSITCTDYWCNTLKYVPDGNPLSILFPSSSLLTGTEADTGVPMGTLFLTSFWSLTWSVCLLPIIFRFCFFSLLNRQLSY